MSHASNQIILIWKDVEALLSRHELTYSGVKLRSAALKTVRDAYSLWVLCTHDSLLSGGSPPTLDTSWIHFLCSLDVRDVGLALKDCDSLLLRNECVSYDDFKHHLGAEHPFIGRLLSPMKQIIVQWFDNQSIPHFSIFHSWLSFIGRVNIDNTFLKASALEDYLATEESLKRDGFTRDEALLLSDWLPRSKRYWFDESIRPHHSGGSTADAGRHLVDKYQHYSDDAKLRYVAKNIAPPYVIPDGLRRRCRLVFVPKSLTAYRSISMEPCSLMWVQQGVKDSLVSYICHHRYLSTRFVPEDQEPNRELAWLGSIDGSFATIDLSSASDSVTWSMARTWFRDTFLFRWLVCTRSSSVLLPDGSEMALKKFAPMGSALCFPIECLIFCAITECAIRECGADPRSSHYRVYGDDIVVETEYVNSVMNRLEENGFKVNLKKSFWTSPRGFTFRESCGGEYLNGCDVTPCRISRRFSGLDPKVSRPSQIEGLIELANDCYSRYPSVRRRIVASLKLLRGAARPLFNSTGFGGLFSVSPTNWHLPPAEWSQDYQRDYICHGTSRDVLERNNQFDYSGVEDIRLFEYLRQVDGRPRLIYPEDRVDVDLHRRIAGDRKSVV